MLICSLESLSSRLWTWASSTFCFQKPLPLGQHRNQKSVLNTGTSMPHYRDSASFQLVAIASPLSLDPNTRHARIRDWLMPDSAHRGQLWDEWWHAHSSVQNTLKGQNLKDWLTPKALSSIPNLQPFKLINTWHGSWFNGPPMGPFQLWLFRDYKFPTLPSVFNS